MSPLPPAASIDPLSLSAPELVELQAQGRLTAEELARRCLERLAASQPTLNAVTHLRREAALEEARALDARRLRGEPLGPLHGVPLTVKDCLDVKGMPSTFGLPSRAQVLAAEDNPVVARLRAAGAVIIAKTNVAQALAFHETENPLFGRTNHPASSERSPGGSSGGEAAALAAQGSVLGVGTDIGGSVRVPAHSCGLVGFKPGSGTLDDPGRFSFAFGQRAIPSQVGFLGRDVATVRLGFQVATGQRAPDLDWRGVTVATFEDDGWLAPCPASRRAVREAAAALTAAGATVRPMPAFEFEEALHLFFGLLSSDALAGLVRRAKGDPLDPRIAKLRQVAAAGPLLRSVLTHVVAMSGRRKLATTFRAYGRGSADEYFTLVERLEALRSTARAALGDARFLLSPSYALPALRHGASAELIVAGVYVVLFNVLGWPAGVIPWTAVRSGEESARVDDGDLMTRAAMETERGSAGLPIGVQLSALPGDDAGALAAMEALARLRPHESRVSHRDSLGAHWSAQSGDRLA